MSGDRELGRPQVRDARLSIGLDEEVQARGDDHHGTLRLVQGGAVREHAGIVLVQLCRTAIGIHEVPAHLRLVGLIGGKVANHAPGRAGLGCILKRKSPRYLVEKFCLSLVHGGLKVLHRDTADGSADLDDKTVRLKHGRNGSSVC